MSTLFWALDVLDVENVGNIVFVPQSETANYSVTKNRSGASTLGMSTVPYYPESFGSTATDRGGVRSGGRVLMVTGVAMVSAVSVFFALCQRDSSLLHSAISHRVSQPVQMQAPVVLADSKPAADSVTRVAVPTAATMAAISAVSAPAARANNRHVEFTLVRSKRFQQVGSLWVGIWKIDAKHKLYDVSVVANGRRTDRKHVGMNSPVSIASSELGRPMQLVVNGMNRGSVSGFLSEAQAAR